MYVGLMCSLQQ